MIVTQYDGRLLVVAQPDHGVQTGLIAQAWGGDMVAVPEQRARADRLAATHHDDGWAVWERRPPVDPSTRRPVGFQGVGPDEHIPVYRAGIARAAQLDPWTGLMVSMHGAGLYNDRYGTYRLEEIGEQRLSADERALVEEFLGDMAALQHQLYAEAVGHRAARPPHELPDVMTQYLLLQAWDRISLQFALRHAADGAITAVPAVGGGHTSIACAQRGRFTLALDPYPFVESRVELPVAARLVPDRDYADPEDFLAELAAAAPIVIECAATPYR